MNIRVASIIEGSRVNGPGNRYIIWLQGCHRKCFNCYNKKMQKKFAGTIDTAEKLGYTVITSGLDGVTVSGGEPFDQAKGLLHLLQYLNSHLDKIPLGIIVFTGYSIQEIRENPLMNKCADLIDLIITGEYVDSEREMRCLAGSKNQKFIFLDKPGRGKYIIPEDTLFDQSVEVHEKEGELFVTGFPWLDEAELKQLGISI